MFTLDVGYSIKEFVEETLKKKFPNDPLKQQINDETAGKLNFACPYCGDSESDHSKKRGNLFFKTNTYKCFNDGCMKYVSLEKFISKFATKYKLPIPDIDKKEKRFELSIAPKKKGSLISTLINKKIGEKLLDFNTICQRFSLYPCSEADPESEVGKFVSKRMLNRMPAFEKSCYYDSRQDKIYIFNLDLKSGKILGFAIRRIDDTSPKLRYNIKNYSELKESGLVKNIDDSLIDEINSINNYFNIFNISFTKPVTVLEGQIDSMFIENAIATTGVTKSKTILGTLISKKNARILFDNDKAGQEATIQLLHEGYSVFLWAKLLFKLRVEHPNRSREIGKIKDINDLYVFLSSVDPEISFEKFNSLIRDNFSNSPFDIILI